MNVGTGKEVASELRSLAYMTGAAFLPYVTNAPRDFDLPHRRGCEPANGAIRPSPYKRDADSLIKGLVVDERVNSPLSHFSSMLLEPYIVPSRSTARIAQVAKAV